jgi:hypothetical protein
MHGTQLIAVRRLATRAGRHRAAANAPQRVLRAAQNLLAPTMRGKPEPPSVEAISEAVTTIAEQKNGYQAWSLYVALNQAQVPIAPPNVDRLAGAMLNVDRELHSDVAGRRTLSVLDAVRKEGRTPSLELLRHGAAACALIGLPDLAEALCLEAEARLAEAAATNAGDLPSLSSSSPSPPRTKPMTHTYMRARLIEACGRAGAPSRAIGEYDRMRERTGRNPPGYFDGDLQCAIALLHAHVASDELEAACAHFSDLCRLANVAGLGDAAPAAPATHMDDGAAPRAVGRRLRITAGMLTPLLHGCAQRGDVEADLAAKVLAMARRLDFDISSAAVREFARAGTPQLRALATDLHREARSRPSGFQMPIASTTVLARACLLAGDTSGAAEVLGMSPSSQLADEVLVAAAAAEQGGRGGRRRRS